MKGQCTESGGEKTGEGPDALLSAQRGNAHTLDFFVRTTPTKHFLLAHGSGLQAAPPDLPWCSGLSREPPRPGSFPACRARPEQFVLGCLGFFCFVFLVSFLSSI